MKGSGLLDAFGDHRRDYYGGALMVLLGLGAILIGRNYQVGSLTQMGSGFFPVALGAILLLLGAAIAGTAKRPSTRPTLHEGSMPEAAEGPEWRGWLCILGSVLAFIVLGRWGGLVPATFAISFISALGDRENTLLPAAALGVIMTLVAVGIFWWALQIQFPLFSWG